MFIKPIEIAQNKSKIKRSTQPIYYRGGIRKRNHVLVIVYSDDEDDMKEMVQDTREAINFINRLRKRDVSCEVYGNTNIL